MINLICDQRSVARLKSSVVGCFQQIRANRDGATAVEFAFAAPVLIMLLIGTVELGTIMFTSSLMEGALRDASRYGITGQEPDEAARLARIKEIVGENTLGLIDMTTAKVDVLVYPAFGDIGKPEGFVDGNGNGEYDGGETYTDTNGNGVWDADSGAPGPGGSGDIVLYRLSYDWPILTPLFGSILPGGDALKLSASLAVRNEPFGEL